MKLILRLRFGLFLALTLFAALQGVYSAPLTAFPAATFTSTVTATSTVTNTLTPTLTFTPSPTSTPTLTPTPEPLIEVLLFTSALIPSNADDPYFFSLRTLSEDGIETIIGTNGSTRSIDCGDISPDGELIVYSNNQEGHYDIYMVDVDGSNSRRLTRTQNDNWAPRWSPDGQHIVFMSLEDLNSNDDDEIYVINADGSNLTQITNNNVSDRYPAWSPDGEQIVFHSNRNGNYELYTITPEGDDLEQLTNNDWVDARAMYNPDGEHIVFNANHFDNWDLFVIDTDGNNLDRLTRAAGDEFGAVWSSNGERITYVHTSNSENPGGELWQMNADGSDAQVLLADNDFTYSVCDWGMIDTR